MTPEDMATIACFLNLATDLVKNSESTEKFKISKDKTATGHLAWLTGTALDLEGVSTGASQETQCLSWRDDLWIANNEDGDTEIQMQILKKLNIYTGGKLLELARSEAARKVVTGGTWDRPSKVSEKANLFRALVGINTNDRLDTMKFFPPKVESGKNPTFNITTGAAMPVDNKGIVFVVGEYKEQGAGSAAAGLHAEQKLIAAYGLRHKADVPLSSPKPLPKKQLFRGEFRIHGTKPPCAVCKVVLERLFSRIACREYGSALMLKDLRLADLQTKAGFAEKSTESDKIRSLDLEYYFPINRTG